MRIELKDAMVRMRRWCRWDVYEFAAKDAVREYNVHNTSTESEVECCLRGLEYLMENTGNTPGFDQGLRNIKTSRHANLESIRFAFEAYYEERQQELVEYWEDDPEDFIKWNRKPLSECEHPWGDDEVKVYRAWLELHPFERYLFTHYCEQAGREALMEMMDDLVVNEYSSYGRSDASQIHERVREEAERLMDRFTKNVEKGVWTTKKQPQELSNAL